MPAANWPTIGGAKVHFPHVRSPEPGRGNSAQAMQDVPLGGEVVGRVVEPRGVGEEEVVVLHVLAPPVARREVAEPHGAGGHVIDDGAVSAVVHRRRSLLAAGITGVEGDFEAGDVVELIDGQGVVVARGMVGFDAVELPELIGRSTRDLPAELRREVIHADDLVPV